MFSCILIAYNRIKCVLRGFYCKAKSFMSKELFNNALSGIVPNYAYAILRCDFSTADNTRPAERGAEEVTVRGPGVQNAKLISSNYGLRTR